MASALSGSVASCAHVGAEGEAAAEAASAHDASATASPRFVSPYAYAWFIRAELLRARGLLPDAVVAYRNALADADEDPYVLSRFATALDEVGDRKGADAACADALALDAYSEAAWLARGQIAEHHGELENALSAYEHAEAAAPAAKAAPLALASLLRAHGADERAVAVLTRFEARTLPGSAGAAHARLELALARHDATSAYAAAQQLLRTDDAARATLTRTAQTLLNQGEPQLARRILLALPPNDDDAALRLSVLLACGRRNEAEAQLETTAPVTIGGLSAAAAAYLAIGRAEQALGLAQVALSREPERYDARVVAARAQLALNDAADAADGFASVPEQSASFTEARAGLAAALRASNLGALARELTAHAASPVTPVTATPSRTQAQ